MPIQSVAWIYFCIPRHDAGNAILSEPSGRSQNAATWLVDGRRLSTGPNLYKREGLDELSTGEASGSFLKPGSSKHRS